MIEEIKDELIGKDLDYLIANVDKIIARYEKWENKLAIIKTYPDEKYKSKHKFVYEVPNIVNASSIHPSFYYDKDLYMKFDEIEIPDNTDKVYFSMTYNDSLIIGQGMNIKLYQLPIDFKEKMNDINDTNMLEQISLEVEYIRLNRSIDDSLRRVSKEIEIKENVKYLILVIEPIFTTMSLLIDDAPNLDKQDLRFYKNDLFDFYPYIKIFKPLPGEPGWGSLWVEKYELKRLTYFISDEVPIIEDLDDYDFANVWLCERDIYDEEENLLYEKDGIYGLKTEINYHDDGEEYQPVTIIGWQKLNITKEDIDNGYTHYFFSGWNKLISELIGYEQWFPGITFKGTFEFGDIMFSTTSFEWAAAEGEQVTDTEFKFNKQGMYITNNEEGYTRQITANEDMATNMQTGEIIWRLTENGQWVKTLEAKEIRMGNYHIVEENDELNIYYRGGA